VGDGDVAPVVGVPDAPVVVGGCERVTVTVFPGPFAGVVEQAASSTVAAAQAAVPARRVLREVTL
jgi:hypothetical protein